MSPRDLETMTLHDLARLVNDEVDKHPNWMDRKVKIWLPGSRVSLGVAKAFLIDPKDGVGLMIEGNIDPGSALGE